MTILCEPNERAAAIIAASLGDAIAVPSLAEADARLAADASEDLVVLGRDLALGEALQFSARLRQTRPKVSVLLLRGDLLHDEVAAAAEAGVREVVPSHDIALLVDACHRVRGQQASVLLLEKDDAAAPVDEPAEDLPQPAGSVITVFSPKGGSGKTTTSTNLAVALHDGGAHRVCLVDLDLEFGDVAISLQLAPVKSLVDAVTTDAVGQEDLIALLTTEYRPGMDCILAPIEPGDAEKIPAQVVSDLIALLRYRYEYVVIDTPSQFSEHVLAALDLSDHHVLVTNPEIPSVKNMRLTLDMLDLLSYEPARRSIVLNRADDSAGITASEVEQSLKMPLAVQVPASRDVPASINKGVPIVAANPKHQVSVAIKRYAAQTFVGEHAGPARRGFFRRRSV